MKIFEGTPKDLLSENVQDLIINNLIQAFTDYHHFNPSKDKVLSWRQELTFALFAEDEWHKDKELIHRSFFRNFAKSWN